MCQGGTLQTAECHPCTLFAECHPFTSDSLRNFTPMARKVSPQDFLPILGAPQPKITNWFFWPSCDQNLALVILRYDHESNFWNFYLERLRNFTPMVPKVSLPDFLPRFGAPRPEITNRSFWLSCNQMVSLTGVRPKSGFGHLEVRPWVKFSKFLPGETSELYTNGPESFRPGFFTPFWRATDRNYESAFLTVVRPNGTF